jgi:ribonuclease HI
MEMLAAIEALESLKKAGQEIEIRTDSTYLKNAAESWMKGWKRRGWRKKSGEPIANVELVKRLDGLLAKYTVTWRRVPGHAGEPGNEYADMLTNHAMDGVQAGGDGNDDKRHDKSPVAVAYSR